MRYYTSTAIPTTLAGGGLTSGATSVTPTSITGLPTSFPFTLLAEWGTANQEVITVTQAASSGTYANCLRGQDGTTGVAHSAGVPLAHGVSARDYAEPQSHIAAASAVHGLSGTVVGTTDTQTLSAKILDSTIRPWLRVSGTAVYEGTNGPRYRATGYNYWVGHPAEFATGVTAAQQDLMFARLRPNSLVRAWAYASNPGTVTWATTLAYLDSLIAGAQQYGHRLILTLGLWGTGDFYGAKTSAWITGQHYLHSVFGANSYQDWVTTVAARYATNPTAAIYDLMNEPTDDGTHSGDYATFASTASGWVKAAAPNALVYMGIGSPTAIGGSTPYATVTASLDLSSFHNYDTQGVTKARQGGALATSKPTVIDEYGVWAKGQWGTLSDSDLDSNGLPAMTHRAQSRMVTEFLADAFSEDQIFAALIWSYQDKSPTTGPYGAYTGAGAYEPINGSPTHEAIYNAPLDHWRGFTSVTVTNQIAWLRGVQALRYAPGTPVCSATSGLYAIFDSLTLVGYTQATSANAPLAKASAVTLNGKDWPSLYFDGSRYVSIGWDYETSGVGTIYIVVVPTATPATSNFFYLFGPATASADAAIRITSGGVVQLVKYAAPTTGTVVATGSIVLTLNVPNLIMVRYTTASAYRIDVNTVTDVSGSTAQTFTGAQVMLGAAHDGTQGLQGHLLELIKQSSSATTAEISSVYAYLTGKYLL